MGVPASVLGWPRIASERDGLHPKSEGLHKFCALDISPLNLVLAMAPAWKGLPPPEVAQQALPPDPCAFPEMLISPCC